MEPFKSKVSNFEKAAYFWDLMHLNINIYPAMLQMFEYLQTWKNAFRFRKHNLDNAWFLNYCMQSGDTSFTVRIQGEDGHGGEVR